MAELLKSIFRFSILAPFEVSTCEKVVLNTVRKTKIQISRFCIKANIKQNLSKRPVDHDIKHGVKSRYNQPDPELT